MNFRRLLEALPAAAYTCDAEGLITHFNERAVDLWGRAPKLNDPVDRFCGSFRLFAPDGETIRHDECWMALALRENQEYDGHEIVIERPDGSRRRVSAHANPLHDEHGRLIGAVNILMDITGRKRAEEALHKSENQLRNIFQQSLAGIAITDANGHFTLVNEQYCRMVARSAEELYALRMQDISHPDDLPRNWLLFERMVREGTPFDIEKRYVRPDGSFVWVSNNVSILRGGEGQPVGAMCISLDVSERKRIEEAMRENEARLRFMLDSMPQKIFTATPTGDVDYFNPQWMEFTGLSFEQIKDWGWTQFIHPDDVAENVRTWKQAIQTGEPLRFEHRFRRADGQYRWHLSRAMPVRDGEGRIIMWIGANTEVHDVKEAQEALREADRRKDEFLATLAHELRNPLAPIRNSLQLLKMANGNVSLLEQIQGTMDRQIAQMVRLVDDLLDVSRISRGKMGLRQDRAELAPIIHQALETVRPLIDQSGHELIVALSTGPIHLNADAVRLAQAIGNLLTNACKFTPRGGRIELTVRREGEEARIHIKDTGIGIPPPMLAKVFEMFTQVDRSLERTQGGLGIGLTLVQRLIEMHDGSVTAHSDGVGRGSEFVVRLPILPEMPQGEPAAAAEATAPCTPRRILLVDDNRDATDSLAVVLRLMGHEVHTAYDGPEGVAAAERLRPDVVLLDLGMPKLNGFDVCRRIRQMPSDRKRTLIALTGWGTEEDRRRTQEAGFDAHLVKPVDPSALRRLLG